MNKTLKCKYCHRPFSFTAIIKIDLLCKECRIYKLNKKYDKHNTRT